MPVDLSTTVVRRAYRMARGISAWSRFDMPAGPADARGVAHRTPLGARTLAVSLAWLPSAPGAAWPGGSRPLRRSPGLPARLSHFESIAQNILRRYPDRSARYMPSPLAAGERDLTLPMGGSLGGALPAGQQDWEEYQVPSAATEEYISPPSVTEPSPLPSGPGLISLLRERSRQAKETLARKRQETAQSPASSATGALSPARPPQAATEGPSFAPGGWGTRAARPAAPPRPPVGQVVRRAVSVEEMGNDQPSQRSAPPELPDVSEPAAAGISAQDHAGSPPTAVPAPAQLSLAADRPTPALALQRTPAPPPAADADVASPPRTIPSPSIEAPAFASQTPVPAASGPIVASAPILPMVDLPRPVEAGVARPPVAGDQSTPAPGITRSQVADTAPPAVTPSRLPAATVVRRLPADAEASLPPSTRPSISARARQLPDADVEPAPAAPEATIQPPVARREVLGRPANPRAEPSDGAFLPASPAVPAMSAEPLDDSEMTLVERLHERSRRAKAQIQARRDAEQAQSAPAPRPAEAAPVSRPTEGVPAGPSPRGSVADRSVLPAAPIRMQPASPEAPSETSLPLAAATGAIAGQAASSAPGVSRKPAATAAPTPARAVAASEPLAPASVPRESAQAASPTVQRTPALPFARPSAGPAGAAPAEPAPGAEHTPLDVTLPEPSQRLSDTSAASSVWARAAEEAAPAEVPAARSPSNEPAPAAATFSRREPTTPGAAVSETSLPLATVERHPAASGAPSIARPPDALPPIAGSRVSPAPPARADQVQPLRRAPTVPPSAGSAPASPHLPPASDLPGTVLRPELEAARGPGPESARGQGADLTSAGPADTPSRVARVPAPGLGAVPPPAATHDGRSSVLQRHVPPDLKVPASGGPAPLTSPVARAMPTGEHPSESMEIGPAPATGVAGPPARVIGRREDNPPVAPVQPGDLTSIGRSGRPITGLPVTTEGPASAMTPAGQAPLARKSSTRPDSAMPATTPVRGVPAGQASADTSASAAGTPRAYEGAPAPEAAPMVPASPLSAAAVPSESAASLTGLPFAAAHPPAGVARPTRIAAIAPSPIDEPLPPPSGGPLPRADAVIARAAVPSTPPLAPPAGHEATAGDNLRVHRPPPAAELPEISVSLSRQAEPQAETTATPTRVEMPLQRATIAATGAPYRARSARLTLATPPSPVEPAGDVPAPAIIHPEASRPEAPAIQTQSDSTVRRGRPLPPLPTRKPPPPPVTPAEVNPPAETAEEAIPEEAPAPDLDALARDVLPRIKRLLAIERERRPMW